MPSWIDDTEDETIYMYYEEPKNFIPDSVWSWFDEYEYYSDFNSAPSYNAISSRFVEMKNTYKAYLNFWSQPRANNEGYS